MVPGRGKGCNSLQPRNYCTNFVPTIARVIDAIVDAIVGAIASRLQTIATVAAASLVPAPLPRLKTWAFNAWFWGRSEIVDLWGLGGPGGPKKPFQKVGGEAPHLLEWFLGPPGPPKPEKSAISGRPKNHVLKAKVYVLIWSFPPDPEIADFG